MSVYLSFLLDDSYTPSTLAIRAGTGPSDLQDVRIANLEKPEGWITFDVSAEMVGDEDEGLYDESIFDHSSAHRTHSAANRYIAIFSKSSS